MNGISSLLTLLRGRKCRDVQEKFSALERAQIMIELDAQGQISAVNENFCSVYGDTIETLRGREHRALVADVSMHEQLWTSLARAEPQSGVFRYCGSEKRDIYLQGSYLPVLDTKEYLHSVTFVGVDVTQQKLEAELAASFAEFSSPAIVLNAGNEIVGVSSLLRQWLEGQQAPRCIVDSLVASSSGSFYPGNFAEKLRESIPELQLDWDSSSEQIVECEFEDHVIRFALREVGDKRKNRILVLDDLTQTAAARRQLEARQKQCKALKASLRNAPLPTCIVDKNFRINALNPLAEGALVGADSLKHGLIFSDVVDSQFGKSVSHAAKKLVGDVFIAEGSVAERSIDFAIHRLSDDSEDLELFAIQWRDGAALAEEKNISQTLQLEVDAQSTLIESLDSGIVVVDNTGAITRASGKASALLSRALRSPSRNSKTLTRDDLIGMNIVDIFKDQNEKLSHKDLSKRFERNFSTEFFKAKVFATPLIEGGRPSGAVLEWRDRSEEVDAENDIRLMVEAASKGDFSKHVSTDGKDGFLLGLCEGLNTLVSTMEVALNDVVRMLGAMAKGDLSERITRDYQGAFGQLKTDANTTADKLSEVIQQIRQSSSTIATTASEIAQGNVDLSSRTEQQASSLEQTAASMEQMTSTVRQSADNADKAQSMTVNTQSLAREGGDVVEKAVAAMNEINKSSKQISDIIGVIDEIAFQTNLLALNAAVEAARAGEQGRGFAVVAGEVRNLAQRSAGAAKEIKGLIQDSVSKVEDGTGLVNRSGQVLHEIVNSVDTVTNMMQEIAAASKEQSAGIEQVNMAVTHMDEMTQQNAALVEEATAAGESMSDQARAMNAVVEFFSNVGERPALSPRPNVTLPPENKVDNSDTFSSSNARSGFFATGEKPQNNNSGAVEDDKPSQSAGRRKPDDNATMTTGDAAKSFDNTAADTSEFDDDDEWEEF